MQLLQLLHCPLDRDRDLTSGQCYPPIEQLGPEISKLSLFHHPPPPPPIINQPYPSQGVENGKFKTLQDCVTWVSKFETKTQEKSRVQDAKSPKKETLRAITNASEILRSGQSFPRTTFFEEPSYTPLTHTNLQLSNRFCHKRSQDKSTPYFDIADTL